MQTRCMNCMSLTEQAQGLCPNCGKPLLPFNEPPALSVGAVLQGRYLIGAVYTDGKYKRFQVTSGRENTKLHKTYDAI